MTVNDQHVLILFRIHCGLAQAQFDAANPSVLNLPYVDIVSMVVDGCRSLGLLNYEEESEAFEMTAEDLNRRILDRTERTFPRLVPVGELAQVATIRLLYRGTKMEESDMSEIMALELTAMFAAKKIGIHDEIFMEWHRSMFDDDANPQSIMQSLETIVRDSLKALCIFLSYRRDDTELFVGRISDRLVSAG